MKTKAVSVSRLFKTNVQYNIPLFQRYYLHSALVLIHFGIFRQTHVTKGSKQYK